MTDAALSVSDRLNGSCFCVTLDRNRLYSAMEQEARDPDFSSRYLQTREHLFADSPVFLARQDLDRMTGVVQMIEAAARLPAYREAVLSWAPATAGFDPGPRGALMGYDFHLGPGGPRLIEVNTNAGGALLCALLAKAQRTCCPEIERGLRLPLSGDFEAELIGMFEAEWAQQRSGRPLQRIAIVDDDPESQYLHPEFVLARQTFLRHGIDAVIADAQTLRYGDNRLWAEELPVDLVYNRLVDFSFQAAEHAALRDAYLAGDVAVTPNPRNHALLADKRNLTLLSDRAALLSLGLPAGEANQSRWIPRTVLVTPDLAEELWEARKGLFFKPATGHGAKAVYRGDKLTRGVWQQIVSGTYVAQDLVRPGERMISLDGEEAPRKTDIRLFTYEGRVLLAAARLYQGQTTNFRTPGGGFASVVFL